MSRKISAKEIVADIKQGLSNDDLKQKYELSQSQLEKVISRLIDAGHMTPDEFPSAKPATFQPQTPVHATPAVPKSSVPDTDNDKAIPSGQFPSQRYSKTEDSGLDAKNQERIAVIADAPQKMEKSTGSSTPPGSSQTAAGEKTKRSFKQQAANASWIIPLIAIALMGFTSSVSRSMPSVGAIVGICSAVLLLCGFVSGIIGCFGVKRHGARTTLVPGLIGSTLSGTLLVVLVLIAGATFATNRSNAIQKSTDKINAGLPKMMSEELRWDKVTMVNASLMEYHYTFINKLKDEIDADRLVAQAKPMLLKNYSTGEGDAKRFRENKISWRFTYRDKEGQLIATIVVPEEGGPDKGVKADNSAQDDRISTTASGLPLGQQLVGAAANGNTALVRNLLDKGANANAADISGVTPLMFASYKGHTAIVEMLLQKGIDPNTADMDGETALIKAACEGQTDAVKLLLDKGADGNAAANVGITPLMCASHEGHTAVVEMLLQKGIDPNTADKNGETALTKASCKGQTDAVKLLLDKGADGNAAANVGITPLMCAAHKGHAAVVEMLLQKGADPNAADEDGETALIKASCKGHVDAVKLLLSAGANKDAKTKEGVASLQCASANGHAEVVKVLTGETDHTR